MSFIDEEDIFAVLEQVISEAWEEAGFHGRIRTPFPRVSWHEAMQRYGSDKPDTRFGLELRDLTEVARGCGFRVFADVVAKGGEVKAITVPGGADLTRGRIEGASAAVWRTYRARALAPLGRREEGWEGGLVKFFGDEELERIAEIT